MSLLLAIPCYGSVMHIGTVRTIIGAEDLFDDFLVVEGESAITRGRSNMLTTFMQSGYDRLFMLDADCEIDRDGIERLLAVDEPIVGAAVNLKTPDFSECLSVYKDGERLTRNTMPDTPFEVDLIGGACLTVTRGVVLEMMRQYQNLAYDSGVHLFHEIVANGVLLTEDYAFCQRARDCGFSIWCEPSVRVRHHEGRMHWTA